MVCVLVFRKTIQLQKTFCCLCRLHSWDCSLISVDLSENYIQNCISHVLIFAILYPLLQNCEFLNSSTIPLTPFIYLLIWLLNKKKLWCCVVARENMTASWNLKENRLGIFAQLPCLCLVLIVLWLVLFILSFKTH